jgi:hypothetical protein
MIWKDQIFIVDVMIINLTWETMASSVISWPTCAAIEFRVIVKIHKYRELYKGHHFILMAVEVHGTPRRDIDRFIRECIRLFYDRRSKDHLSLFFCIQFFR